MLNVPVNNSSVMLGRSHRFLGITSTFFVCVCGEGEVNVSCSRTQHGDPSGPGTPTSGSGVGVINHQAGAARTGAVVKPRTLGLEILGSSPPVAVRCGLEQVTYPQLLR